MAHQVAEVYPDLLGRNAEGQPESVRYDQVPIPSRGRAPRQRKAFRCARRGKVDGVFGTGSSDSSGRVDQLTVGVASGVQPIESVSESVKDRAVAYLLIMSAILWNTL